MVCKLEIKTKKMSARGLCAVLYDGECIGYAGGLIIIAYRTPSVLCRNKEQRTNHILANLVLLVAKRVK